MAPVRAPHTPDHPVIGSPSAPVVTVALATRPAAHLRGGDRRRLARQVSGAERRLSRVVPPSPARARVVRRLWSLAARAVQEPAGHGVVLVASGDGGRLLTLEHPITDRVIVGPALTDDEIIEATWAFGRLAVLRLTTRGTRLVCSDGATLWEPRPPWDPLGLQPHVGLERADLLVRTALPSRTPLVIAGDDRLVRALCDRGLDHRVAAVLPGDHSETSPATLAALAQRTLRRSLDARQRRALARLALAVNRGQAVTGLDVVRSASMGPDQVLLVEVGARPLLRDGDAGATLVVLPDGFLAHHGRAALAPDHRAPARGPGPEPDLAEPARPVAPARVVEAVG